MYDLTVIGAGWAGFNAALKAKQAGFKVCLIERGSVGGACLNRGCIPTKTLIASAKAYSLVKESSSFGVQSDNPRFDFNQFQERKNNLIQVLSAGMQSRLSGVDLINASAEILPGCKVDAGGRTISARFVLIATGSRPADLPQLRFDGSRVLSSDDILELKSLPRSLLVVGGGVIGCEFASLFNGLGVEVSILEKMPAILNGMDKDVSKKIEIVFKKKGIVVYSGAELSAVDTGAYEKVLVCVGRQANTEGLGLDKAGIKTGRKGILVDDHLMTSQPGVYAAGDCTAKLMLAHYAAYQGAAAVESMISGNKDKVSNNIVPSCVFCDPEAAGVGLSEEDAVSSGASVEVRKFDFRACAMARIIGKADGFIKVVLDRDTQEILGGCIVGPSATELISVLAMAVSVRMKIEQLRSIIFAHPTLSESLRDSIS